jgi:C4-type Zn-finger protein
MSPARTLVAVVAILVVSAGPGRAGEAAATNLEILLDTIRANKKALVAVNLTLTDEEAAKFWPVYDRYQKELAGIQDRFVAVIQDYTTHFRDLSDEKALKLVDDYLSVEADRVKVRRAYVDEVAKALPGRKVARFYQIENKMDAVLRYDLAAQIPVVEE